MHLTMERSMVVQAVLAGQIGTEHVTVDELVSAHHLLADAAIQQTLWSIIQSEPRNQVRVFDLDWQYLEPN